MPCGDFLQITKATKRVSTRYLSRHPNILELHVRLIFATQEIANELVQRRVVDIQQRPDVERRVEAGGEGARRFVFEGSECGGHIGPLSSAALWDAQLETLRRQPHLDELELLFAGGIHDATSAGLLTVMTSEVAARGAKVGVVMGTAYLFTQEAVESGAAQPIRATRIRATSVRGTDRTR